MSLVRALARSWRLVAWRSEPLVQPLAVQLSSSAAAPSSAARGGEASTAAAAGRSYATASAPAEVPASSTPAAAAAGQQQAAEESLEEIRARIFGYHVGNGERSGRKVLRGALKGPRIMEWYPVDPLRMDPFMPDMEAERAKLKLDRLRRRGKAPPKKGQGKRSGKKK